ncbi:MAG: hypothetical protein DWQ06_09400, partial [Calditrichaeota bacterium]
NIVVNSAENTGSNVLFANINDLFNDSKFTKPTTRSTVSAGTKLTYSVSQKFTSGASLDYTKNKNKGESTGNTENSSWTFLLNFKISI